jgi:hypothetical protein
MVSLSVQIFLKMARVDVAEKSSMLMARMEDDATLTQLTTGDSLNPIKSPTQPIEITPSSNHSLTSTHSTN